MLTFETRNDMIKYFCSEISNPKILEIGIFKGEFFDYIAENCNPGSLDGVDLFEGSCCSGNVDGNDIIWYDLDKSFKELTEKYKDNVNINLYKKDSSTFLSTQNDNTYDVIYIDGDHSYEGVKKDLYQAFKKIKKGGYIMGHDYEMNFNKAKINHIFGVRQAVDEFCHTYNQTVLAKAYDGCVSFCIQVSK